MKHLPSPKKTHIGTTRGKDECQIRSHHEINKQTQKWRGEKEGEQERRLLSRGKLGKENGNEQKSHEAECERWGRRREGERKRSTPARLDTDGSKSVPHWVTEATKLLFNQWIERITLSHWHCADCPEGGDITKQAEKYSFLSMPFPRLPSKQRGKGRKMNLLCCIRRQL